MMPQLGKTAFHGLIITIIPTLGLAAVIQPVSLVSEEYVYTSATTTIDNKGMIQKVDSHTSLASALLSRHSYDTFFSESYVSLDLGGFSSDLFETLPDGDTDIDLVFDLTGGGNTPLQSAIFWQYQNTGGQPSAVGNCARTIEIRINTEAEGKFSFSGKPITITLKPVTDGDQNPDNDLGGVNSAQVFPLDNTPINGRYVQVSITDNYLGHQGIITGGDRVGLGEIRFSTEQAHTSKAAHTPVTKTRQGAAIIGIGDVSVILKE